jgi:hypothetical protein
MDTCERAGAQNPFALFSKWPAQQQHLQKEWPGQVSAEQQILFLKFKN